MKRPVAHPVPSDANDANAVRAPRAFLPTNVAETEPVFEAPSDTDLVAPPQRSMGWAGRIAWTAGTALVSLGLGLAADRLIRDLFSRYEWLGWAGIAMLALFVVALAVLVSREIVALRRLQTLDTVRRDAAATLLDNSQPRASKVLSRLEHLYADRADLARARQQVADDAKHLFDGHQLIQLGERSLMLPLDTRAKALTAASARRVALVTAVSPRALVDIGFVLYESIRLAGAIAALYGARPGFFGFWRLTGAILAHLAVTGGLVLTDGLIEQLVGQGLAAKLSARLGEGVVNGLMTVRVGIAAMRVVRPLPFSTQGQPMVKDFIADLANIAKS